MIHLKALLWALVVWLYCFSYSNADVNEYGWDCNAKPWVSSCSYSNGEWYNGVPDQKNISDDGHVGIPLEFGFNFFGTTYTYSWMHSNGVISFLGTNSPSIGSMCCNGIDMENYTGTHFNHFIAPLWTDTISINKDRDGDGINDNGFFVESFTDSDGNQSQRYLWQNHSEYYNTNTNNTFRVELFDTGKIDIHHDEIDIRNHSVTVGVFGNVSNGEIDQVEYFANQTSDYTVTQYNNPYSDTPSYDPCITNPLYSTTCSGYAEALYQQQCTSDPLYDSGCPGYATAYYNQQCTADPLYDSGCPGYATAYYNQQCAADPLYDEGCNGYEQAYYETYVEPNIETGTSDPTETETVVETVYVEEDYSEPQILDDAVVNEIVFDEPQIEVIPETEPEPFVSSVPEIEIAALIEEPVQEVTLEDQIEAEIEPQPEPEPVEEEISFDLFSEETEEETIEEPTTEEANEEENGEAESSDNVDEQVDDTGSEESSDGSESSAGEAESSSDGEAKSSKPDSKREKVKKLLAKKAAELAKQLAVAQTLEQQQAIQNEIFALKNFNYEFKGYSVGLGYDQYTIPNTTQSPATANRRGLRNGLAQELLHRQMVEMQWNR